MHSVRLPPEGRSSPRPWGCFSIWPPVKTDVTVFPTPVGVFLGRVTFWKLLISLPHARGGVSMPSKGGLSPSGSSPRPWGCFLVGRGIGGHGLVFPTPVGVFQNHCMPCVRQFRLPHARGGVSYSTLGYVREIPSSPRPWGCFLGIRGNRHCWGVFPTPVGVFRMGRGPLAVTSRLPHARGGVSRRVKEDYFQRESSPRPWGCFQAPPSMPSVLGVFPTPVGVFLYLPCYIPLFFSLPHARGGVSAGLVHGYLDVESSPRPWGCFFSGHTPASKSFVFPTPVGVFLPHLKRRDSAISLPHARGGVSC